jgi:hypothetical protein
MIDDTRQPFESGLTREPRTFTRLATMLESRFGAEVGTTDHPLGELAASGDQACTRGDFEELARLARVIAERVPEPLHCELVAFADVCSQDPSRAITDWQTLRARLFG